MLKYRPMMTVSMKASKRSPRVSKPSCFLKSWLRSSPPAIAITTACRTAVDRSQRTCWSWRTTWSTRRTYCRPKSSPIKAATTRPSQACSSATCPCLSSSAGSRISVAPGTSRPMRLLTWARSTRSLTARSRCPLTSRATPYLIAISRLITRMHFSIRRIALLSTMSQVKKSKEHMKLIRY